MITVPTATKPADAGAFTDKLIAALAECAQYLSTDTTPRGQELQANAVDLITTWCLQVYKDKQEAKAQALRAFMEAGEVK